MKTLLSVAILSAITSSASAVPIGTAAETAIDNTASIAYSVGSTVQSPIASSPTGNSTAGTAGTPTTFVVDKKIDLLVTGGDNANVVPSQTGAVDDTEITFTITNEGNSTETFILTPSDSITPIVVGDNFNSTGCTVTATGPLPATTVVALPAVIASGDSIEATVECDIPSSATVSPTGIVTNGEISKVDLLAEVSAPTTIGTNTAACNTNNGTAGANETCDVDIVFADGTGTGTDTGGSTGGGVGDRNGKHSATSTYTINTASLTVTKTEAVTAMVLDLDDDGGTAPTAATGGDFHIPGSTITYTIEVDNTASAATGLVITDTLDANLTFVSCTVVGSPAALVPAAPTCGLVTGVVTTGAFTLSDGSTTAQKATMTIEATVN